MYGYLTNAFKRRLINDLRRIINDHPEFKDTLKVLPRFPLKDRPGMFIHLTGSIANLQRLAPDNYMGEIVSHVQLLRVENKPGLGLEWVKENGQKLETLVAPGLYYVDFIEKDQFVIDPLYEISEVVYPSYVSGQSDPNFTLANAPVVGKIFLVRGEEVGERIIMEEGTHFTINRATGEGIIIESGIGPPGWGVKSRYWTPGESTPPYQFQPNTTNLEALPGVVLAFGRRSQKGDKQAVRVTEQREATARAIGGKWELSMDIATWGLDPDVPSEIMDFVVLTLWGYLLESYTCEGIALSSLDIGGETEEVYDPITDQTYFTVNGSISALCDWEIHIPLPFHIFGIEGADLPNPAFPEGKSIAPTIGRAYLVSHSVDMERIR